MKIRQGFVSNSSGSSFIIAIAAVFDRAKLDEWLNREMIDINKWDGGVFDFDELAQHNTADVEVRDKDLVIEAFDEVTKVKLPIDSLFSVVANRSVDKEAKRLLAGHEGEVFAIRINNDEGDEMFWNGEEYDYDITLDRLPSWQKKLYEGLNEDHGLMCVDKAYGAGRNG
jgi:hypothetical protein